jgi:hypothetical protein
MLASRLKITYRAVDDLGETLQAWGLGGTSPRALGR